MRLFGEGCADAEAVDFVLEAGDFELPGNIKKAADSSCKLIGFCA